jgi:hypothetical protein
VARSLDLAASATKGQVSNPASRGRPQSGRRRSGKTELGHSLCGTNFSLYRIHLRRYWTDVRWRFVSFFRNSAAIKAPVGIPIICHSTLLGNDIHPRNRSRSGCSRSFLSVPLIFLESKSEGRAEGAAYFVAQSKRDRPISRHGSNAGHSSGVAGVDARTAPPRDPMLMRWGLANSPSSASGATWKMSPFYIRKMLRKATFSQVFDDFENRAFDANLELTESCGFCLRETVLPESV